MNYDKNSFLAGLAVGRQLKGWATAGVRRKADPVPFAAISPLRMISALAAQGAAAISQSPGVQATLSAGSLLEISVAAPMGQVQIPQNPSAFAWLYAGETAEISADVTVSEQISGTYTITTTMEVE
ncbi:MAG: hypothetical protein J6S60_07300 [Oscillospiraceae bacterium]|nr:hypothetical protein [Oscillospiraceae bacterium]